MANGLMGLNKSQKWILRIKCCNLPAFLAIEEKVSGFGMNKGILAQARFLESDFGDIIANP
jgi:hypothetical protein